MSGSNWFGNLQLAYKYIVVFLGLLVLTIVAGFIKVIFDRRKLKKAKKAELEAGPSGPKEDTVELNQREKDEGDLFGIRAIEAGFYAGVAQSRPTSRAGSIIEHPNMSSSTLVGNPNSPLMKGHSATNSVPSLKLGNNSDTSSQQRKSPPTLKLRPSEAELSGRRNHNGAVDMSLQVPPSPGHPRGRASPTFGGSDSDSDGFTSPRSTSPRSADFNPQHYAPAPTIPMPDALRVSYHSGSNNNTTSQSASFNNSPGQSPTPPSPGNPPATRLPTLPVTAMRKESRSPSPEYDRPQVRVYQPSNESAQLSSAPRLQPQTYASTHKRDESNASSVYSNGNRLSTYQAYQAYQKETDRLASAASTESYNYNFSSTDESGHTSVILSSDREGERRPSQSSSLLAPASSQNGQSGSKDSRLSEFYDAYYRNSHIGSAQPVELKRPVDRKSTIVEVDSPMPSPLLPKTQQPGAAF